MPPVDGRLDIRLTLGVGPAPVGDRPWRDRRTAGRLSCSARPCAHHGRAAPFRGPHQPRPPRATRSTTGRPGRSLRPPPRCGPRRPRGPAGHRQPAGAGPLGRLPRTASRLLPRGRRLPRPGHLRHGGVVGVGHDGGGRRAGGGRGAPGIEQRRGLRGRPAARSPRAGRSGHGLLSPQQRGRDGRLVGQRGRASPRVGLGRPPRQRHPGPVLGGSAGALRLDAPVALLPRYRAGHRRRRAGGRRHHRERAPPARFHRGGDRGGRGPGDRAGGVRLPPVVGAGLRRFRRPSGRPLGRPGPVGRGLRRAGRSGRLLGARARARRVVPRGRLRPRRPAHLDGGDHRGAGGRLFGLRTTHRRRAWPRRYVQRLDAERRATLDRPA